MNMRHWLSATLVASAAGLAMGQKDDFPPFADVSKDFRQVNSSADGEASFFGIWVRDKDQQMLAELPRGWQNQKHFIAMTVPTGEIFSGLQAGDVYVYWKRYDNRLALVSPQIAMRSSGDQESKISVDRIFTDTVLLDVPILCMGPNGQPVIDMDSFLTGPGLRFFGGSGTGANARLCTIKTAKAFPKNVELAVEMPVGGGGLRTFHYSISLIQSNPSYKPREADERVGFFTTEYTDLGRFQDEKKSIRYINRWHLEKADAKLKMSPAKEPIVFYVEHTVPVRYRRWVREGVLYWNKAFEKVGISNAIEVYYQDKATGAHMDKDPEDRRYNFLRWLSNDVGTAIGPSRADPMTGQILDADIVLTDGWIRHFWFQANEYLPQVATEGLSPETLQWLESHPSWDPRVRMASPQDQDLARRGILRFGGELSHDPRLANDPEARALAGRVDGDLSRLCMAARGKSLDMALMGMNLELMGLLDDPKTAEGDSLDGIPEWFVGPMLADLVCHEVGHTLGLRHNFKASSIYSLKQINSNEIKGQKAFAGSVMDYIPVNINVEDGEVQGDYTMRDIGPYDFWAIEYGYTMGDTAKVLERAGEPELVYQTDEDTSGPDPLARRYDFAADPLDYANSRMRLTKIQRENILEKFVKKGDSWAKARRGYSITLGTQTGAIGIMANWIGGTHVARTHKGDPAGGVPLTPVEPAKQRAALKFVVDNAFKDEAFGLTPELLRHMTVNKDENRRAEPVWNVHDSILGVQASALTMVMNPTALRRVLDNEFVTPSGSDAFTLPELLTKVTDAIWTEVQAKPDARFSAREPMISSLRRNLQREHLERLIDLTLPGAGSGAAFMPISNLSMAELRRIKGWVDQAITHGDSNLDPYTVAHLTEAQVRITKALDAQYIYNVPQTAAAPAFGPPRGQPTGEEELGDR